MNLGCGRCEKPFGFRNNYALGMRKDVAAAKGVANVSDLRKHPQLRLRRGRLHRRRELYHL